MNITSGLQEMTLPTSSKMIYDGIIITSCVEEMPVSRNIVI